MPNLKYNGEEDLVLEDWPSDFSFSYLCKHYRCPNSYFMRKMHHDRKMQDG